MFTGLVQATGVVNKVEGLAGGKRVQINTEAQKFQKLKQGASVAVDGVCLTVVEVLPGGFEADLSAETVEKTTFSKAASGKPVNLEKALEAGQSVDGHFVTGHVDAAVELGELRSLDPGYDLSVELPEGLEAFVAPKGSVALDGISLTVNEVDDCSFSVRIIPHTYCNTTLESKQPGDYMNLEVDMLARYLYNFWQSEEQQLSLNKLNEALAR